MRIYFAGHRYEGHDIILCRELVTHLQQFGDVLTEELHEEVFVEPTKIHNQLLSMLVTADVVVAEISSQTIGVGYLLGRAAERGQKVLCLYKPAQRLAIMLQGCNHVTVKTYMNEAEAKEAITDYFAEISAPTQKT
jgi:2'-deoxynucleoside 5'-phosphate N-hydrolase